MQKDKKKIINIYLVGGLGNQLFQFAFGKSLEQNKNIEIRFEKRLGFIRDFKYKRKFRLNKIIKYKFIPVKLIDQLFFICIVIIQKFLNINFKNLINEKYNLKVDDLNKIIDNSNNNLWIKGYWQNENHFKNISKIIYSHFKINELQQNLPPKYQNILSKINSNSICICVRNFEEVPLNDIDKLGGILGMQFYKNGIKMMRQKIANPQYFIFSINKSNYKSVLNLPSNTIELNHDNGFDNDLFRLVLLSNFQNHILSNSTFYWWSAWLAEKKFKKVNIFCSNNFPNPNTKPERWISINNIN